MRNNIFQILLSFIDHTPVGQAIIQNGKLVGAVTHVILLYNAKSGTVKGCVNK
jgi:hypothetical protein